MAQFKKATIDEASSSVPRTAATERLQPCGSNRKSDSLFMMYEPPPPRIISIDIIFFHGLQVERNSDAYLSTWTSGDSMQEVWPERWLPAQYPGARILFASYDAFVGTTGKEGMMDMHLIGENLLGEILWVRRNRVKECPVILVGHSFGGLVIKQLCLSADKNKETVAKGKAIRKFLEDIRGIFFYATPHRGMNTAVLSKDIMLNSMPANTPLLSFVELLGKESARLHEGFENQWKEHKWLIYGVGELHAMEGRSNLLVEEASSRFGVYISVECDHFSVCRPVSRTSNGYLHLVELIEKIYDQRSEDERRNHEHIFKNVMGLESLVAESQELLKKHSFLGFCGMGGVGKTTIAKLVFKTLSGTFEYTCFVSEVKLIQGNKEVIKKKIWENMHHHDSHSVPRTADVRGRKLLVVFDDIDKWEHAELLQELADDNAPEESRFITTSRDAEVLRLLNGNYVYRVPNLEPQVSRELFIAHAFPGLREPLERLKPYVVKVVEGCAGLPLTLEVLGKYLQGKTSVRIWDDVLEALRNAEALPGTLEERVWRKLKVSYDSLGDPEKYMFLDIASFLLLESCPFSLQEAISAWSSMFGYVHVRWETLMDRSLIQEESTYVYSDSWSKHNSRLAIDISGSTLPKGHEIRTVRMHEHLRRMGQRIAKETGRYFSMMASHCGGNTSHAVKIVAVRENFSLHSDGDVDDSCSPCKVQKFFSRLEGVRYLGLDNRWSLPCERCRTSGGFSLPRGLVMFEWRGSNVNVKVPLEDAVCTSLAVLRLERDDNCSLDILSPRTLGSLSSLKHVEITCCRQLTRLPETFGNLSCLTDLKIVGCSELVGLPEKFGNLSSLERLELQWCSGLERLPESFGNIERSLKHLQIQGCIKLKGLRVKFGNLSSLELENLSSLERLELQGCFGLERLQESFGNIGPSLKHLQIQGCINLECLPESFGNLRHSLEHLQIADCAKLEGLPETFGNLSSLERLELRSCSGLQRLPESLVYLTHSLEHLQIADCAKLKGLPEAFGNLSSLERLELRSCSGLQRLPLSFGILRSLKNLKIDYCRSLKELPETFGYLSSLERLELRSCSGLERLAESFGILRSLKNLKIDYCRSLKELPETFGILSSLERLEIKRCWRLERLPESFGNLGRSLKHLEIVKCSKLEVPGTIRNWNSLKRSDTNSTDSEPTSDSDLD